MGKLDGRASGRNWYNVYGYGLRLPLSGAEGGGVMDEVVCLYCTLFFWPGAKGSKEV